MQNFVLFNYDNLKSKMGNYGKNRIKRMTLHSWVVAFLPYFVMGQTRLTTSTLMVKSQMYNGGSVNPLTKGDARASFDYSVDTGNYDWKNSSTKFYSGGSINSSNISIGYEGKTEFGAKSGHYSLGHSSSKTEYEYKYTNSSIAVVDIVYAITDTDKTTNLVGGVSAEINDTTSIGAILNIMPEKGDLSSTGTLNNGYVWTATGTSTRSTSGSASADYNQIRIYGMKKIKESINAGFTFIPEALSKSKYSDDYSTLTLEEETG